MREGDCAERIYLIYQGEFELQKMITVEPPQREFDVVGYMHAEAEERSQQQRNSQKLQMEKSKKKKGINVNTTVSKR